MGGIWREIILEARGQCERTHGRARLSGGPAYPEGTQVGPEGTPPPPALQELAAPWLPPRPALLAAAGVQMGRMKYLEILRKRVFSKSTLHSWMHAAKVY